MGEIYYDPDYLAAARDFGGALHLDKVLKPVLEALQRNPFAFQEIKIQGYECRCAIVARRDDTALVVTYTVDDDLDVCLRFVEVYDPPY
jgi:hypothetical protein